MSTSSDARRSCGTNARLDGRGIWATSTDWSNSPASYIARVISKSPAPSAPHRNAVRAGFVSPALRHASPAASVHESWPVRHPLLQLFEPIQRDVELRRKLAPWLALVRCDHDERISVPTDVIVAR